MTLDLLDKRILSEIELNTRISDTQLAKNCRRSKDTIRYRIKKLKKDGIITGSNCFVDYTQLGMNSFKLYLTIDGTTQEYQDLIKWAKTKQNLFCIFEAQTGWHIALAFFANSFIAYEKIEEELHENFGHIIKKTILTHMTKALIFQTGVFIERNKDSINVFGETHVHSLDEIDKKILRELHEDASQTYVQIAQKTHCPIDSVIRRKKKLEEKNIIRYYGSHIDYKKIGFEIYKVFIKTKQLSQSRERELKEYLASLPQTRNMAFCIGPWKIETEFIVEKHDEIFIIVEKLKEQFSDCISNIEYTIFHNEYYCPAGLKLD